MALTEKQEFKVEVIPPYCVLQIRRADIIERDGVEVARAYHRHVCVPGDDCSNEAPVVQKIAAALHDAAAISAYQASLPEPEPEVAVMPSEEETTEPEAAAY